MTLVLSRVLGPHRRSPQKDIPYESGVDPKEANTRQPYYIKFYLVAALFILFDIETVFIFPWAVVFRELPLLGLLDMFVFIGILAVGLFYILKKGILKWD